MLLVSSMLPVLSNAADAQHDHAHHQASMYGMDEQGRRMHGMEHSLSEEQLAELRQRVEQFARADDAQIAAVMGRMGSSYEWYISDKALNGNAGVLILAHGYRDAGDAVFRQRLEQVSTEYPTALGLGMAMTMSGHLQYAVDDLQAAGAETIVVVPVVSGNHNSLMRQWNYIFGRSDEPAYTAVPRVTADAELRFASPPEDHPLIRQILLDHAAEISTDPDKEFVLVAAHGPESAEDNEKTLAMLNDFAEHLKEEGGFAAAGVASLQDDAPHDVRQQNVLQMRETVKQAQADGYRVLVVTNLIGARVVQSELRRGLRGLDYTFNAKGIAQHDNFILWIDDSVKTQLAD